MKKTIIMLALATTCAAYAQKPIKVQVALEGESDVTKYYLEMGKEGELGKFLPEEELEVKKGKFSFTKQINRIIPASLKKSKDDGTPIKLFLVPGENLKLTINGNDYFYGGSKIYKEYGNAHKATSPKLKEYTDYVADAEKRLESTPEEHQESLLALLRDTVSAKMNDYRECINKYYEDHKSEEGVLLYCTNNIDVNTIYNGMSEEQKKGRVGEFCKSCIDYKAKMRAERERQQQEREAKLNAMSGTPAKDFTLNGINGSPLSLSSLSGKYVVLDFWGSWCGWCIKGIPDMKKYYEKYAGKLEILGIDCNDTEDAWKKAVEKYELPWLHVYNPRNSTLLSDYAVQGFPTKIVIDPQGVIAKIIVGEDPAFYTYLDEILSK